MAEKEIYLLRHGDTGRHGLYIGSLDVPLSFKGREEIRETAKILRQKNIDKVLSSPMLRCRETCRILDMHSAYEVNDLLKEVDFGRWEGKSFSEILASDPGSVTAWANDPNHFCFPGGEALPDFHLRISAIKNLLEEEGCRRILVVSHGGVIRHLLCLFLGLSVEKYLAFDVQPGGYSSLTVYENGAVLTGLNLRG
jgi:alpha-ribazole phosphatase